MRTTKSHLGLCLFAVLLVAVGVNATTPFAFADCPPHQTEHCKGSGTEQPNPTRGIDEPATNAPTLPPGLTAILSAVRLLFPTV